MDSSVSVDTESAPASGSVVVVVGAVVGEVGSGGLNSVSFPYTSSSSLSSTIIIIRSPPSSSDKLDDDNSCSARSRLRMANGTPPT